MSHPTSKLVLVSLSLLLCAPCLGAQSKPNVLLIIADDIGVDGIAAYKEGANPPPTPNLDALAKRGVLFRNAYANPVCSPTRCTIFTRNSAGSDQW